MTEHNQLIRALALTYHPCPLGGLEVQEHVSKAMHAAVTTNRADHHYMSCGVRGTGKSMGTRVLGFGVDRVRQGHAILDAQPRSQERFNRLPANYAVPNVSEKLLWTVHRHTNYVQRVVGRRRADPAACGCSL